MSSWLRIVRPDGSTWEVPASVVAADLAAHQARQATGSASPEGTPSYASAYQGALDFLLQRPDLLERWAVHNMDWSRLAPHAREPA